MDQMELPAPRYVDCGARHVAGLTGSYTREQTGEIPKQWEQFNGELYRSGLPYVYTLGVVYPLATMQYVSGVEIEPDAARPEGWVEVTVPPQRYAVFAGAGGIPTIRRFFAAIFMDWLPKSGRKVAEGPMIERYPESWVTSGDFEIWIPVDGDGF
jgi:AraC family transcriptional regulator